MIKRIGFVSNSSSSSFVIAAKKHLSDEYLTNKIIQNVLGVSKQGQLFTFAKAVATKFIESLKNNDDFIKDEDDWFANEYLEYEDAKKMYDTISTGAFYNDSGDPAENAMVELEIIYKDNELFIWKELGY
jgi:hypothetical protein